MREEDQGTPTDKKERWGIWKQMRSAESVVEKEEPEREVDQRIERTAQDVIPKEEAILGQIQKWLTNDELEIIPNH